MCIRDRSSDAQRDSQYPWDVAGPEDQVAQENEVNSKYDQGHGPCEMKRMEPKPNLRMQRTGSKDGQVIRCGQKLINIQQAKYSAECDGGVRQLEPRSK